MNERMKESLNKWMDEYRNRQMNEWIRKKMI